QFFAEVGTDETSAPRNQCMHVRTTPSLLSSDFSWKISATTRPAASLDVADQAGRSSLTYFGKFSKFFAGAGANEVKTDADRVIRAAEMSWGSKPLDRANAT